VSKSVPGESELDTCRRFGCLVDREQMLCQLGMDVSRENSTFSNSARRKSLDCNYQIPLETAYEDFGVERKLVELRPATAHSEKQASSKTGKRLCKIKSRARTSLGNIGMRAPSKGTASEEMKTKVLSLIRGKHPKHSVGVPKSIVAVVSCREDQTVEKPTYDLMTGYDRRLVSRDMLVLSNRRMPQAANSLPNSTPSDVLSSSQRKEGTPSISSCGDTTVKWGNGRKERRMFSSGISI
ncbi:hypothetical protein THAOC_04428, partial [Thalassiosira oceanica]